MAKATTAAKKTRRPCRAGKALVEIPLPVEVPPLDLPEEVIERIVGLLVSFRSRSEVYKVVVEHEAFKLSPAETTAAIDEASRRIALAANHDFDAEVGTAKTRLNDLYEKALATADVKTALAAVKERNRLLSLYPRTTSLSGSPRGGTTEAEVELLAIRTALLPLVGVDEEEPTSEIARRVVSLFVNEE